MTAKSVESKLYLELCGVNVCKNKEKFTEAVKFPMKDRPIIWKRKNNFSKKLSNADENLKKKYSRGTKALESGVKTNFFKEKIKRKEIYIDYANEQAGRTEILLNEEQGFIIPDEEKRTKDYKQSEIAKNVDITAASKYFQLNLDFGPYYFRYTRNGRHLLLGGKMGHVAAFDWITKKLHCEMNVMEEIADISWLHSETLFACAQKNWVYIYDDKGTEIHCVKKLYNINQMEFLPYHFLLATASSKGFLSWLDVSIGEIVGHYNSKLGNIHIMRQNPVNSVTCIGSSNGIVSMWCPKIREPLAKILCHSTSVTALAVDPRGVQLVTGGLDRKIKVWDIRQFSTPLAQYNLMIPPKQIDISQKGVLVFSMGNVCEIFPQTVIEGKNVESYLKHRTDDFIYNLKFCPFEDVLGISTERGFTSILVPGSGEPNFDSFEINPFQTKSQRRENEIHALLEKIPAEFITLDPNQITDVDTKTLKNKTEIKKNILYVKPPSIDFKSGRKMKWKKGPSKAVKNKQIVKETVKKEFFKNIKKQRRENIKTYKKSTKDFVAEATSTALNRFKLKNK